MSGYAVYMIKVIDAPPTISIRSVLHILFSGAAINNKYQQESDDPKTRFYKSRDRYTPSPFTGKTPIYDFDEWSRAHYGETFQRDIHRRNRAAQIRYMDRENVRHHKFEKVVVSVIVTTCLVAFMAKLGFEHDRDKLYGIDTKK